MRNAYMHNLPELQSLDSVNEHMRSAHSVARRFDIMDSRTLIALDRMERILRESRNARAAREIARGEAFTSSERAWFKRPIGGCL